MVGDTIKHKSQRFSSHVPVVCHDKVAEDRFFLLEVLLLFSTTDTSLLREVMVDSPSITKY